MSNELSKRKGLFDARELRAIGHYLTRHTELAPMLQHRHDRVNFVKRETRTLHTVALDDVVREYDEDRQEAARERTRLKRHEARR